MLTLRWRSRRDRPCFLTRQKFAPANSLTMPGHFDADVSSFGWKRDYEEPFVKLSWRKIDPGTIPSFETPSLRLYPEENYLTIFTGKSDERKTIPLRCFLYHYDTRRYTSAIYIFIDTFANRNLLRYFSPRVISPVSLLSF